MNLDILSLLLPILWAVIATGIGLVLYKTSEALFESTSVSNVGKRRIRLVGSVTIAALAFYGMKLATPSDRLRVSPSVPEGAIVVKTSDVESLHNLSIKLDRAAFEAQGCVNTLDSADCSDKLSTMQEQTTAFNSLLEKIIKDGEAARKNLVK